MKLLRTIRFDESDERIFDLAAPPGEWAVPGGFAFAQIDAAEIVGKTRQAFANGFLGLSSFGRSTFATVGEATVEDIGNLEYRLGLHFVQNYGAPDIAAAQPTAREELAFVADLCRDVPINTVFTLRRFLDDNGEIREEFRKITAPGAEPMHTQIWSVVDDDE